LKENESLKKKVGELEAVALKRYRKHVDWQDYSPWYVGQLKASIETWNKVIWELKERVIYLQDELEKKKNIEDTNTSNDIYVQKLEEKNEHLSEEVEKLKWIVRYLSKYLH
jgi:predicted RNase H-like nuclease (RuvC/YqgF family)